ncbi:transcriptional elongation factor-like protein Iws1 [Melanomma pulvis-pyrius CBS 109.77]|uniref:Transcriptional elongation factor-like protein Iws1 n=1 Tax=Melanomma pulvis-pyrius CBS 109.77 TaxID=1314802 RepID=A0A6A6XJP1_9PLEO|nr:transcriptional elongation factor-like protein Iws1 [Melanomma pulvis-pyrius CBS 109.77]
MEDPEFKSSHSNSPLPEAGHDPDDPLRPEIDEENSTPNPPITDPHQDMEVTDERAEMPDQDDLEEAGLSDNESVLSELDEGQFEDFDAADLDIEERPAQMIDDTNVNLIGVHKRKRTEADGELPKKKKKKADKPRRKKTRGDDEVSANEDSGTRKSRRSRKEGKTKDRAPAEEEDESLTPEERRKRAFQKAMDDAVKPTSSRRRKKGDIDLDQMADAEIEEMRRRMAAAAEADNEGRKRGEPARHKLKLLPEVVALLNKNTLKDSIVDPEINLLEAVRFFLEPLSDGSLPAYDIQKGLFAALGKLPINKDSLVASGIGKVIMFYIKSKRPELVIKRQAERLFTDWTRPILRRTDDYRKKEFVQADYDPTNAPVRSSKPVLSHADKARAKALEAPRAFQRARMEAGPTTYTVVPKSNVVFNENVKKGAGGGGGEDIMRKIRGARGGGRR